jgi:hypothetical protein
MLNLTEIKLNHQSLNAKQLTNLKWTTTIAIVGIPVLIQLFGAMMMFSQIMPQLLSTVALSLFALLCLVVMMAGIYVCSNRLHLRFLGFNRGLDEWEIALQLKAKAFAYQVVFMALFALFVIVSLAGFIGTLGVINLTELSIEKTLTLNTLTTSVSVVMIFYIIMFLPTLYMVWNIKPLSTED